MDDITVLDRVDVGDEVRIEVDGYRFVCVVKRVELVEDKDTDEMSATFEG